MSAKGYFSINEFAKYSRTTHNTLYHYDQIGLLPPALRGDNGYRYYFTGQLAHMNLIQILKVSGMALADIKDMMDQRTPHLMDKALEYQLEYINTKIDEWVRARKLLSAYRENFRSAASIDETSVTVQFYPAEAIILGDINDYSRGRNDYDALYDFYHKIADRYPDLDMNYPVWGLFREERINGGDWVWPDRYYFFNPEGHDKRPAALYAVGHTRGGYGNCDKLYKRIIDYINENEFEICGDAYEEYPLNEVFVADNNDYLIRVMITVRKKAH